MWIYANVGIYWDVCSIQYKSYASGLKEKVTTANAINNDTNNIVNGNGNRLSACVLSICSFFHSA